MIPIYICDDEKNIREFIAEEIKKYITIHASDMQIVACSKEPEEVLQTAKQQMRRGIYFFDVDLQKEQEDGFTLAKKIRDIDPRGYIIFITTHAELSFETFRYRIEAMDYIVKGDKENVKHRIIESLNSILERILHEQIEQNPYYQITLFDRTYNIPIAEILYFETAPSKHKIILHAEHETLEFFGKLSGIEETIGTHFIRTHRSFLVNKKKIKTIYFADNKIEMTNGSFCLLSRKAKKLLKEDA